MKNFFIGAAIALGVLVLFAGIIPALDLGLTNFWGPKFKTAERNVFEQSKSFNQGMRDDLAKYYEEYSMAEDEEKKLAIKAVVRMRFSDFDDESVHEPVLRSFLIDMRGY